MLATSVIAKKRDGQSLTRQEIEFLVDGFTRGDITDYQMSAFTMAVCIRGMDAEETAALTLAMLHSGQSLPRSHGDPPRIDKHSTGGLGDKVSLILAPLLAAAGYWVPMISGRGLGLTGGTLDKLESIPGFHVDYEVSGVCHLLREAACCIVAASERIAPADRLLYALRDVTATVESVALITASILSKKLAASLDALVMDVKVGSGAFMKNKESACELAVSLVNTGREAGLPVTALLSDMDQPLGRAVGNAIEVNEAVAVLAGDGPAEVRELTLALCAALVHRVDPSTTVEAATCKLERLLDSGAAMEYFQRLVAAQGGRINGALPLHPGTMITAEQAGYVAAIDCRVIGETMVALGAGRRRKTDRIDHRVGLEVRARIGDKVESGQPIAVLHALQERSAPFVQTLSHSFAISESPIAPRPLLIGEPIT